MTPVLTACSFYGIQLSISLVMVKDIEFMWSFMLTAEISRQTIFDELHQAPLLLYSPHNHDHLDEPNLHEVLATCKIVSRLSSKRP